MRDELSGKLVCVSIESKLSGGRGVAEYESASRVIYNGGTHVGTECLVRFNNSGGDTNFISSTIPPNFAELCQEDYILVGL